MAAVLKEAFRDSSKPKGFFGIYPKPGKNVLGVILKFNSCFGAIFIHLDPIFCLKILFTAFLIVSNPI